MSAVGMSELRTCPVDGCTAEIEPGKLMCGTHWARVPRYLRRPVHETWNRFLEERDPKIKMLARRDYLLASSAAIRAVNVPLVPRATDDGAA